MDISSISSALLSVNSSDPGSLANAVSIKMLDNAISSNESLGVGLAKMMENAGIIKMNEWGRYIFTSRWM